MILPHYSMMVWPLGVLCGGLGSALQGKKCGRSGESLIKGDRDNEETGSFLLQEKMRGTRLLILEKRRLGGSHYCVGYLNEGAKRKEPGSSVSPSDRNRGSGHKLTHRTCHLKVSKHFITVRV